MVNVPFIFWWKIGISNRTDLRKKQVSAAAPGICVPIGVFYVGNAYRIEQMLHAMFAPMQVRYYRGDGHSEWFWFPAGMAAWLIGAANHDVDPASLVNGSLYSHSIHFQPMSAQTVKIGVDPAFRARGFTVCILDTSERTAHFRVFRDVLTFDRWLQSPDAPDAAIVTVENSNATNTNFDQSGTRAKVARKGRNVGTNQAVSQLTVQSAIDRYGSCQSVSPKQKGKKWTKREFEAVLRADRVSVYGNSGTQDARDAYKLATLRLLR